MIARMATDETYAVSWVIFDVFYKEDLILISQKIYEETTATIPILLAPE